VALVIVESVPLHPRNWGEATRNSYEMFLLQLNVSDPVNASSPTELTLIPEFITTRVFVVLCLHKTQEMNIYIRQLINVYVGG
jgi:hypothetical protein